MPTTAKSNSSLHSDNSDASSDAKAKSRAQKHAENIEKAKSLNEDFVYAINKCVELNSEDYKKEIIDFVRNHKQPQEIKTKGPTTVYLFVPSERMAWTSKTLILNEFNEDKTTCFKFDLKCKIFVFSKTTTPDNLVINLPKFEKNTRHMPFSPKWVSFILYDYLHVIL